MLLSLLLFIVGQANALGTSNTGFGTDVKGTVERGTFTATGTWIFTNPVVLPGVVVGATVYTDAPILGDGSSGDHLRVDSSSVTLLGNIFNAASKLVKLDSNGYLVIGGLTIIGARTAAQISILSCPAIPCAVANSDDYDLYTATGTSPGQWRNTRLGVEP